MHFLYISAEIPQSKLKKKEFEEFIGKGDIPGYVNACLLLLECDLPEDIKTNYDQLIMRMPILQDAIDKFDEVYHADIDQFNEYFAPEALRVTATYLDYQAVAPSEKILGETRENVLMATKKLVQVVNEKIDEIYMFVTIETNAESPIKAKKRKKSNDFHVQRIKEIAKNLKLIAIEEMKNTNKFFALN